LFANDTNRVRGAVLCLSQDGACTNLFENFSENNLKGDLSNDTTDNPPLFSLVNTFNLGFLASYWSKGFGRFLQVSALASHWLEDCANFTLTPEENYQYSANHSQCNTSIKPIYFYQ
jgi:hypothetical protein